MAKSDKEEAVRANAATNQEGDNVPVDGSGASPTPPVSYSVRMLMPTCAAETRVKACFGLLTTAPLRWVRLLSLRDGSIMSPVTCSRHA